MHTHSSPTALLAVAPHAAMLAHAAAAALLAVAALAAMLADASTTTLLADIATATMLTQPPRSCTGAGVRVSRGSHSSIPLPNNHSFQLH